jgi:hypothetical protein
MWRIPSLTKTRNASLAESRTNLLFVVVCRVAPVAALGSAAANACARSAWLPKAISAKGACRCGEAGEVCGAAGPWASGSPVHLAACGRCQPVAVCRQRIHFPAYRSRRSGKLNRLSTRVGQSVSWMFPMRPRTLARSAWTSQTIPQDLIRPALRLKSSPEYRSPEELKYLGETRMTTDQVEIRVVFHPPLCFVGGPREKLD